ncbi:MAG: T9SS type A sorting domain-containing protein [Saprospiraceae bacterium]|nr:T9SS type A sorting domain-containing protein [Saprospiraceae bacterium]
MKTRIFKIVSLAFVLSIFCQGNLTFSQSYLIGPASPAIGTSANYTSHNHQELFNVLSSSGVYIDSITIYPSTASTSYTIYVKTSTGTTVDSYTGTSTVGGNQAERIGVDLFVPMGTAYKLGLNTGSVGMLRNSTGASYPYTVPNVMTFTGSTFQATYWYFFYNLRISLPSSATDAGLILMDSPADTICSGNSPVSVWLKNFGPSSLTSVTIDWKVNNVSQTPFNWSGTLAIGDTIPVNIGSYNFLSGTNYNIVANTSNPNSTADTVNTNDTINKTAIYVKASPTANLTPSGIMDICQNDSLILSVSSGAGLTYQWKKDNLNISGQTDTTLIVKQAGSYQVIVSNTSGCSTISDTAIISVLPIPPATASALGATTICYGDSTFLIANTGSGLTYQWKRDGVNIPGGIYSTIYVSLAGAYTVTTTHPNTCSNTSAPVIITVNQPQINLGSNFNICPTHQITLDAGVGMDNYLWSTGDTTQTILVDSTGFGGIGNSKDFSVTVTQQSCTNSDTITITLIDCTGIPENIMSFGINIYPNPSTGKINFDIPAGLDKLEISIYNTIGQIIFTEQITSQTESLKTIDLSDVPKGFYFISLKSKEKQNFVKVILN